MIGRILLQTFLLISLVIIQLSFISGLPGFMTNLNLILVALLFVLVLSDLKTTFAWVAGAGFLFDLFSFLPFGVYLVSFSLTFLIAYFLYIHFFTDRSLYAFMSLTVIATISNQILLTVISYFIKIFTGIGLFTLLNLGDFTKLSMQLVLNISFTLILFQIVNFISHKLKPVFLIKSSKL